MTYADQHEPWHPDSDLSYDGLPRGDRGVCIEHLAPNLKSSNYWFNCHSSRSMITRISVVRRYIKSAQEKAAN